MFLLGRRGDYFRLFRRRWLFFRRREFLTWWHRGRAPVGLRLFFFHRDGLCWRFFWSRHLLGYRRSVLFRRRCDLLGARFSLFLFRLLDLNHLASLKLIRKIRRSRLLSLAQVRAGKANTCAHNENAHRADWHGENVRSVSGTSTYWFVMNHPASARAPRMPLELCCEGGTFYVNDL